MGLKRWWLACGVVLMMLATMPCWAEDQPVQGAVAQTDTESQQSEPQGMPLSFFAPADFNRAIFHKNKLEFSLESGGLWVNTPLILDFLIGQRFARTPGVRNYTLIPTIFTLRWHLYDPSGPSILRGNTDFTFGGVYTAIAQGPETLYAAGLIGLRYNFIQPNSRIVPYLEIRGGMGWIDARGPNEVRMHKPQWGQGQDLDFTFLMGAGFRYAINRTVSVSLAGEFMHISNMYMSEPRYYNHGINTFGPMLGMDISLENLFRRGGEDVAHKEGIQRLEVSSSRPN